MKEPYTAVIKQCCFPRNMMNRTGRSPAFMRYRMNRRIQSTYPCSARMLKRSRRMTSRTLIEQPGLAPNRGWVLRPVHAVFSYGRARPLYNLSRRQGIVSLTAAPAAT